MFTKNDKRKRLPVMGTLEGKKCLTHYKQRRVKDKAASG